MARHRTAPVPRTGALIVAGLAVTCGPGDLPSQAIDEVAVLGCVTCDGPTQFAFIRDVVVLDQHRILVLDRDAPVVRIIDLRDETAIVFGGRGGGPGEFRAPTHVSARADGDIQVVDLGSRLLTRFDSAGSMVQSLRIPGIPVGAAHHPRADELYVVISNMTTSRLARYRRNDESFAVVVPSLEEVLPVPPGHPLAVGPAAAPDGSVAVGDGTEQYRILVYGPTGRLVRELRRDVEPTLKPKAEYEAELQAARRRMGIAGDIAGRPSGGSHGQLDLVSEYRTFFDRTDGLEYDDDGTLWVRTNRGSDGETIFDLFDPSGAFAGAVTVPKSIGAFDIGHGLLAGTTSGSLDEPTVTVWRIGGPGERQRH